MCICCQIFAKLITKTDGVIENVPFTGYDVYDVLLKTKQAKAYYSFLQKNSVFIAFDLC